MTEKKSSKSKKAPAAVPETTPVAAKAPPEAVKAPVEAVKAPAVAAKPAPAAKAAPVVAAKAPVEAVKPVEAKPVPVKVETKPAVTAAPAPATTPVVPGVVAVKSATLKSAAARMFTQSIATAKATANTSKSHRVEDSAKVSQKPMGAGGSRAPRRGAAKGR